MFIHMVRASGQVANIRIVRPFHKTCLLYYLYLYINTYYFYAYNKHSSGITDH